MKVSDIIHCIQTNNLMKFYKNKAWMTLRIQVLERDHHECQKCRERGQYRNADCVHHMKEVKDYPHLALDMNNLMSLCNTCHNEEHDRLKVWQRNIKPKFINEERW